uniref:MADS-box domain-containing protein n=1 Tax=Setaria italica TaxID=4555 RepID=K3ZZK6_SETIT
METGAKKPDAAGDPAPAPSAAAANATQPPQQALFEAKHAELLSQARDVAREFGVDVHAIVFRPDDGTAVRNEFLGAGREAQLKDLIGRAVARDVSAMGAPELAAHEQHLLRLRALVARELQVFGTAVMAAAAATGSSDKIRRIE